MKNRIWKQIKQITVAAAVAGTVLFGSVQPGMAADSELQSGQELSDDREKEDGYEHMEELASGETVQQENEEQNEQKQCAARNQAADAAVPEIKEVKDAQHKEKQTQSQSVQRGRNVVFAVKRRCHAERTTDLCVW